MPLRQSTPQRAIQIKAPDYLLYGETERDTAAGFIHIESIQKSSRPYRGVIKPHQHKELFQILLIAAGPAEIQLGAALYNTNEPVVVLLPPGNTHGFHFHSGIKGEILSIALPLIQETHELITGKSAIFMLGDKQAEAQQMLTIAKLISEEQQSTQDQTVSLHLINTLFSMINRVGHSANISEKLPEALKQFSALIENQLDNRMDIERYAQTCGVSASTLNRLCKQHFGKSALQMINQRLAIEIKRRLAFTQRSIALISDELGFSDPGYFTRFVKRELGETPMAFRKRHRFED